MSHTARIVSRQEYFNAVHFVMQSATSSVKGSITGSAPTTSEQKDQVQAITDRILMAKKRGVNIQYVVPKSSDRVVVANRYREAGAEIRFHAGIIVSDLRGRGRGREVLSVVRSTDLVLFLIDPEHPNLRALTAEIEGAGVRINQRPPRIVLQRSDRGGLTVSSTVRLTHLAGGGAAQIAREFGLHNGSIVFREDATADQLIDVLAGNRVYVLAIMVVNKSDLMTPKERTQLAASLSPYEPTFISARAGTGLDVLVDQIGTTLKFIRIYVKPPGLPPDREEPVILRQGESVTELLRKLPGDLSRTFKAAQIWGKSARFPGQTVGRDHILSDEDIVTVLVVRGGARAAS